jgi:hypothetical protein
MNNGSRVLVAVVLALSSSLLLGATQVPSSGTVHVTTLLPRNAGYTVGSGNDGFYFQIDANITFTGFSCLAANPTYTFGVPKEISSGVANPAYRDHVNILTVAYTLGKPVVLYVDSCINGLPRVVGMDLQS